MIDRKTTRQAYQLLNDLDALEARLKSVQGEKDVTVIIPNGLYLDDEFGALVKPVIIMEYQRRIAAAKNDLKTLGVQA